MADDFRQMPLPAEVNAFECEISRDESFRPLRKAQHGAVVPNADKNTGVCGARAPARAARVLEPANLGNQRFFWKRHRRNQYTARRSDGHLEPVRTP